MEAEDVHLSLLQQQNAAALDDERSGLDVQQEVVLVAGTARHGDEAGAGRGLDVSVEFHGHDDRPENELFQNQVFIADSSREGVICLMLEDALTTDLNLNLPADDLHNVSNELAIQDNAPERFESPVELAFGLTQFSEDNLPTLQALDAGIPKVVKVPLPVVKSQSVMKSQKKRGGWPKGRKRKPEANLKPPKAPATGYVLYLNERRKLHSSIPFPDVTKLLGNEWTHMKVKEKQIYLDRAEKEKERYQQELLIFKKSDAYKSYQIEQRLKRSKNNNTIENNDNDATEEDDDGEELYCRTCDQWFNTLHNKKEHLYGKQHFQNISGNTKKQPSKFRKISSNSFCDENRMPVVDNVMANFIGISTKHEEEIAVLRRRMSTLVSENLKFIQEIADLSQRQFQANAAWEDEQQRKIDIDNQVCSLLALPALLIKNFCVSSEEPEMDENSNIFSIPLNSNATSALSEQLDVHLNVKQGAGAIILP